MGYFMKRLFLFAGYDRDGIVDDSLLWYLKSLSGLGDIVFVMDNDATDVEIEKVRQIPNVLYANAVRHGEYDFGSYKRAYIWARDNKLLEKYDWVYLVNDSVYGPLHSLEPLLLRLESNGAELTGMAEYQDCNTPTHIQSWFVGLNQKIVCTELFDSFIQSVSKENSKANIINKYEVCLSRRLLRSGFSMYAIMYNNSETKHVMYDCPTQALNSGVPFIKKRAISILEGLYNLYSHTDDYSVVDAIAENMARCNIKMPSDRKYKKVFRMTLFSIPILTIYKKNRFVEYKFYMFDVIPILKFAVNKDKQAKQV